MDALKRYPKASGARWGDSERVAMDHEIRKQMAEYDAKNATEVDAICLYILHTQFGFGESRLRKFYEGFQESMQELQDRFKCGKPGDMLWVCTNELKKAGIDISTWDVNVK